MEVLINRERLLPLLSRGVGVVERRQTLPILGNLMLRADADGLVCIGTDLEVETRGRCDAEVVSEGDTTVSGRKVLDIMRNLPDSTDVRLKVTGDRCVVTAGRGRFVLGTLPASDFPTLSADEEAERFEIEEGIFKRVLDKTAFAMAQQDVRYYLNGVYLEFGGDLLRSVATDGHRLAKFETESDWGRDGARGVIIPHKTVTELRRHLGSGEGPLEILVGEKTIRFTAGGTVTTSKLVDGRYPEYERVIPIGLGKRALVGRDALKGALSRTAVLSNEKYRGVRLTFESGTLQLQAHNPEQEEAVEEIELDFDGEPTTIGFNVAYLSDVLGVVDRDSVEVSFQDGNSSSVWRGADCGDETFVVMPMRL
jgi:DNA polymerase-3 subunit beta